MRVRHSNGTVIASDGRILVQREEDYLCGNGDRLYAEGDKGSALLTALVPGEDTYIPCGIYSYKQAGETAQSGIERQAKRERPNDTRFSIGEPYDVKENPVGRAEAGQTTVAAELQDKFGVEAEVIADLDGVSNEKARKHLAAGQNVKGWYDPGAGKVYLYAPDLESEQDAMATYAHEVIAHKGMEGLLGKERYAELCKRLGKALTPKQRKEVEAYEGSSGRTLGDEYIARIAETLIDEQGNIKEPTTWEKVKAVVREFFRDTFGLELTDADIRYMLWRSSERLRRGKADTSQRAQDKVTGQRLQDEALRMSREEANYQREVREITERAKADGTFMKAPNGKQSNLDERQWAHVRTTRFKRWFGDWELSQLYSQALRAWNDKESKGKTIVSLSDRAKQRLASLLGHDFTQLVITDDAIRHIKKQHGNATTEHVRGQLALTAKDIVTIPYIIENFDTMKLVPAQDDSMGNKAVEVRKRINGVSVIGTIARGKDKLFVVTSWKMEKSDALDASSAPGPNVRNDSDLTKVKKEIENIKEKAENCSKVVDENGEPKVVYHGTPNAPHNIFDNSKKETDDYTIGTYNPSNDDIRFSIGRKP